MKFILSIFLTLLCSLTIAAKPKDPPIKSYKGYLMDKMCARGKAGDIAQMKAHTRTCLSEEACASTGYGVVVGKKFIPFDKKSNELAAFYIKNHIKENDFEIDALGDMKNGKLHLVGINNPPVQLN
jgi:hypothetical protein